MGFFSSSSFEQKLGLTGWCVCFALNLKEAFSGPSLSQLRAGGELPTL